VFKGYFKNPERTKEAFSEDGWLNSGDVALSLPNGAIKIIDRAKNIFKLSQGEYIAPEKLENIYAQCPIIQQIFVYGDSLQHCLVAIIVPDLI
jgi:long-chain acyl-CoA synthetase